jgi:hypothetical protein
MALPQIPGGTAVEVILASWATRTLSDPMLLWRGQRSYNGYESRMKS